MGKYKTKEELRIDAELSWNTKKERNNLLVKEYLLGKSTYQIASKYNVSINVIYYALEKYSKNKKEKNGGFED